MISNMYEANLNNEAFLEQKMKRFSCPKQKILAITKKCDIFKKMNQFLCDFDKKYLQKNMYDIEHV